MKECDVSTIYNERDEKAILGEESDIFISTNYILKIQSEIYP